MDNSAAHPNFILRHCASGMALHVDSDDAYLVLPKSRSRIAGHFQLSYHPNDKHVPFFNGEILVVYKILQHDISSALESKTAGVF